MSDGINPTTELIAKFISRWCPETMGAPLFQNELLELVNAETIACAEIAYEHWVGDIYPGHQLADIDTRVDPRNALSVIRVATAKRIEQQTRARLERRQ